ncbi:nucleotide pyrophosphohydrolase [Brevibacillus humidisoli]|uniref:MazG nucleotide pyrophosphohydrolase domain-containing protein n=1 Tax=Brevibacillus humidisoli TaxID=2895522 RepID=UPI001E404561|nr:MazG nucleotide pyrophosphohydrolase domain-containing protein [Brevibacillus humidisoli]UFJ39412.1 nucleotide pyrophosphohydrolase [Brevibacillus humidisoli]
MDIAKLQQQVADFVRQHNMETTVPVRLLDLASEMGEVSKEVLKTTRYGKEPFHPTAEWESELGDLFFSLICLANSTDVDLEHALAAVLDKYVKRLANSGDAGSGS